jgi:glycosyltransferase involved in cell wall biosynthesis
MRPKPLRIAIASSGLGHVTRGIEAWAADLSRALAERGEDVVLYKGGGTDSPGEVVVPCWHRSAMKTKRLLRWVPSRLIWRLGLGTDYGVEQTTFAVNLIRHLRYRPADVIHLQDAQAARILQRARSLRLISAATILAHGTNEPWPVLGRFTYLQHLAPWHLEQGRLAGYWKPTWTAIPNFIETDLYRPGSAAALRQELGIPHQHLVILAVSAIKRDHKRVDHLLEEFARLRENAPEMPVTLVVAGGAEADTPALIEAGKSRLGDRVRFLVRFPRERMPDLYRLADLFVLCSLREMMPICLLEATATGLPCVVHDHPIMTWIAGPGGVVTDLGTPGTLAEKMGHLCQDTTLRSRLGRLARQHCEANFGCTAVVSNILDYYRFVDTHNRGQAQLTAPPASRLLPSAC